MVVDGYALDSGAGSYRRETEPPPGDRATPSPVPERSSFGSLAKTAGCGQVMLLGEQGLERAVRPELDERRSATVVVLLCPRDRIGREAPARRDHQDTHYR